MSQQTPQPPEKEFRAGGIRASIWRNPVERNGQTVLQPSVKIQKQYLDPQTQQWVETNYFYQNDLSKLILVAQKAYEYVSLVESEEAVDFPPAGQ